MSNIDTYLTQLRSHLRDLDPRRADEIVAEARTHLQSRAAQLQAAGLDADQAASQAARSFGEPAHVAADLRAANQHHRRPVALRAVAAFVIAFSSVFALSVLLLTVVLSLVAGVFTLPANLDLVSTILIVYLVGLVGYYCIALLTGIVGGRRFWWIVSLPGFVMIGCALLALSVLANASTGRIESGVPLVGLLAPVAVFAAIVASLSFLGSRLPRGRRLSIAITIISGSVVGLIWVGLGVLLVAASTITHEQIWEGEAWQYGVLFAVVMPVVVAFLIAGRRDRFLSRGAFIASMSGLFGVGLLLAAAAAGLFYYEGLAPVFLATPILVCFAGLLAMLIYTVGTRSTDAASLPPTESK